MLLLGAVVACASGPELRPPQRTWEDDPAPGETTTQVLHSAAADENYVGSVAERVRAFEQDSERKAARAPKKKAAEMGRRLDRNLMQLVAGRAGNSVPAGDIPPPGVLEQWQQAFGSIDQSLDLQPSASDLGALVRARVTLEVEMDRDRQRFTDLPHELTVDYIEILEKIDQRVRELHATHDTYTLGSVSPRDIDGLMLMWPLKTVMPSSPFGYRRDPVNGRFRFHSGVDLVSSPETPVYAAASGVVVFAAWSGGYGNYVVLEHANGVRTHYAHMAHLFVSAGTVLDDRMPIGTVGNTGRSTGPHLHYAVSMHGRFVDPTLYTNTPIAPDGSIPDS